MQTHKNPELKKAGPPPIPKKPPSLGGEQPTPPAGGKKPSAPELPPLLELQGGKKWVVVRKLI